MQGLFLLPGHHNYGFSLQGRNQNILFGGIIQAGRFGTCLPRKINVGMYECVAYLILLRNIGKFKHAMETTSKFRILGY